MNLCTTLIFGPDEWNIYYYESEPEHFGAIAEVRGGGERLTSTKGDSYADYTKAVLDVIRQVIEL